MHDRGDRAFLRLYYTTHSTDVNIRYLVVIDSAYIHSAIGLEDDADVISRNSSISTAIN
jgi:hypothetical protein